MHLLPLSGNDWKLHPGSDLQPVPFHLRPSLLAGVRATVPGCVHTDLMSAGLLDDPYLADNEVKQFWIGRTDWVYSKTFDLPESLLGMQRIDLACDGLDTLATIEVNGKPAGTSATMHARHRFDIKPLLRAGANQLTIRFQAPRTYADQQRELLGPYPVVGGTPGVQHPHNLIRKMSCNFGWDWGPDVTTSGIFRDIRIEAWNTARLKSVRPRVTHASPERAEIAVHIDLEPAGTPGAEAVTSAELVSPAGQRISGQLRGKVWQFEVPSPALWFPVGHGPGDNDPARDPANPAKRPLYTLNIELVSPKGEVLERCSRRIGLRTTELIIKPDTAPVGEPIPDAAGESMELRISGRPVYCKGANWIPDDCFPHRVTRQRYEARIRQALSANMNMLRVWGGGLFESDDFYDLCDELGVMVWQDFPFACSTYPEHKAYHDLVELEARDNIARLASHPSLVLYNGGNENIVATYDWAADFRKIREEGKKPWGLGYWLDLLPKIISELDPTRPYWPNSPYSGSMDRHPNANEYGNRHMWDVWHGDGQYRNYLAHYPRMATEFGYHAPPNFATLARSIPPEQRYWNSPLLLLHNKNFQDGQKQTHVRMSDDFNAPPPTLADFDAWHYLAQTMQARALSMGIEWFRALYPWNTASLYWQFNDCWPVSSWSAIDGDGRAKPLLHATRRFFAPRLLTIKPRRATPGNAKVTELCAYLHNDTDEPWSAPVTVREVNLHGDTLASVTQNVQVAPRTLARFAIPASLLTRDTSFLVASTPGADRAFWWFSPDKLLSYPAPRFDAELVRTGDHTYRFTLTAHTLLRDLSIQPDRIHPAATISDSHVTLLAGDRHTFTLTSPVPLAVDQLVAKPVLWCANQFGASTSK